VPLVDNATLTSVREQGRVVVDKGLCSVEHVGRWGALCPGESRRRRDVEAREAVDEVDCVCEAVRALRERPSKVRVDALAEVLELRRSRRRRRMPLAALDREVLASKLLSASMMLSRGCGECELCRNDRSARARDRRRRSQWRQGLSRVGCRGA
jgi:hypothetical protein